MKRAAIIGIGTMGSAISGLSHGKFAVIEVRRGGSLAVVRDADIVILAVKPQQFAALANDLREYIDFQMIISIMAGVTVEQISSNLGTTRVVRAMPNLALKAGQSLTAWHTTDETVDLSALQVVLDTWGKSLRLEDEIQFDPFTALAGSGPAYFFELARVLEEAARKHGFNAGQARLIAVQTLLGAANVVNADTNFAGMVRRVASKGGTTEAALGVFAEEGLAHIIHHAVSAAAARSRQLGNG